MDVVYVCRPGNRNEELRFSLRSLKNLPHDRVWIGGAWPPWVRNVNLVPGPRVRDKYAQTTANLLAVCDSGVSEEFVFLNDDVFLLHPIETIPVLYRGKIKDIAREHSTLTYATKMRALGDWLREQGYAEPLSYELHTPMVLNRDRLVEALALPVPTDARDTHKRSLYGNVWGIGGTETHDFKVSGHGHAWSQEWPFISTTDNVFKDEPVGRHIRKRFPTLGPYEEVT